MSLLGCIKRNKSRPQPALQQEPPEPEQGDQRQNWNRSTKEVQKEVSHHGTRKGKESLVAPLKLPNRLPKLDNQEPLPTYSNNVQMHQSVEIQTEGYDKTEAGVKARKKKKKKLWQKKGKMEPEETHMQTPPGLHLENNEDLQISCGYDVNHSRFMKVRQSSFNETHEEHCNVEMTNPKQEIEHECYKATIAGTDAVTTNQMGKRQATHDTLQTGLVEMAMGNQKTKLSATTKTNNNAKQWDEVAYIKREMRQQHDKEKEGLLRQLQEAVYENEQLKQHNGELQSEISNMEMNSVVRESLHSATTSDIGARQLENQRLQSTINELQQQIKRHKSELIQLQETNTQLQNRLSEIMAHKVTDNNPNIVNLGDQNRPDKLVERFAELYDNQWTTTFEYLIDNEKMEDKDAIQLILQATQMLFDFCLKQSEHQLQMTENAIITMTGSDKIPEQMAMHIKICKDERKRNTKNISPGMLKAAKKELKNKNCLITGSYCKHFVKEAVGICWLMCIQDPPMALDFDCQPGAKFDRSRFKHYTKFGETVDFLVWPAVCVDRGGPVLSKGIAQGLTFKKPKTQLPKNQPLTGQVSPPNNDATLISSIRLNQGSIQNRTTQRGDSLGTSIHAHQRPSSAPLQTGGHGLGESYPQSTNL